MKQRDLADWLQHWRLAAETSSSTEADSAPFRVVEPIDTATWLALGASAVPLIPTP